MTESEPIAAIGPADPGGAVTLRTPDPRPLPRAPAPQTTLVQAPVVDSPADVGLVFEVGREARDLVIKVVDRRSQRVIREIPPEEMRRMRSSLEAALGRLLDRKG